MVNTRSSGSEDQDDRLEDRQRIEELEAEVTAIKSRMVLRDQVDGIEAVQQ